MKKFVLLFLVAIMAMTSAKADIVTSTSYYKEGPRMQWFVRAGVSFNSIGGDFVKEYKDYAKDNGDEASFGTKVGFDITGGFQRYFGKSNAYWGAELGFGTRGFSAKYTDYDVHRDSEGNEVREKGETGKASQSNINIKLPIFIGYNHPIGEHMKIDGHVGPYVSYDISKSSKDDDELFGRHERLKDYADVTGLDVGAAVGVGFWYDHVMIDVTYQKGFMKLVEAEGKKGTSSHFLVRVGYAF